MNRITKKLFSFVFSAYLCALSYTAYAAKITPSDTSITQSGNKNEISFDIYLENDTAYAGAEFGIKASDDDVEFTSLVLSDELQNESNVRTIKDGCLYFGFFSTSNKYGKEKKKIATLYYTYGGSEARTISLVESKIVTVDESGKTSGDTSSEKFAVSITRAQSSSGSIGGGSVKNPGISLPDTSKTYAEKKFTDVAGHWAENDIYDCVKKGLFSGISDTAFDPDGTVTRAMAVTVLGRFSKDAVYDAETGFSDVAKTQYYANYVSWGARNGIVKGMTETEFEPESFVTREQISAMIVRYLNCKAVSLPNESEKIKAHDDYGQISEYAKESMAICCEMGLIKGHDDGLIEPNGNLTRAQLASIMVRLSDYTEKTTE